jgi:hypothetical protein
MDRLAEREPEPLGRLIAGVPRRAQMAVFAQDDSLGAMACRPRSASDPEQRQRVVAHTRSAAGASR